MRSYFDCVMLTLVFGSIVYVSCFTESPASRHSREREAESLDGDLQSIVGKEVVAVSGPEKPITVFFDDGTRLSLFTAESSVGVTVRRPGRDSKDGAADDDF
ncbi:hypothetical protein [Kordiimonas sp.]|uniref:hypothetical protein n=1 Tax=Kordiimonas sp. TaxID=1970157 RepID=UPI003A950716